MGARALVLLALLAACGPLPEEAPAQPPGGRDTAGLVDPNPGPRAGAFVRRADGLLPGMIPFRGGGVFATTVNPSCNNPKLSYFGGPLLQSPIIVSVFWSNAVNATLQANMPQFYHDITNSTYWTWLHEYDSVGLSPGTNQAILPGTATAGIVIAPVKCGQGGNNCQLVDADLQAELTRQIGLGVLPAPSLDCTGNSNTLYMIHFPPNISLTSPDGRTRSCVNGGFCGYHWTGTYGAKNVPVVYAAIMDTFNGGCATGCSRNAKALDNETDLASHEVVEAVTDPDIGLANGGGYAFPGAWGDNNNGCGEIGDICEGNAPGDTITVAGRSWIVQQMWSNRQNKCTSTGPMQPICSGMMVANCRRCSCGDNGLSCSGQTTVCETTKANVLFGGCEQCTGLMNTCMGGAQCQQSGMPALDDICPCVPLKACPAPANCGAIANGCGGMINCGSCTAPQSCGGGGTVNVCGCTPIKVCPAPANCGTVPDGCSGMASCGACNAPETCGGGGTANVCGCTPIKVCPAPANCGMVADGCGGMVSCGACSAPETCGGGGTANVCGCTPIKVCPAPANCGAVPDGCGGMVSCGACTGTCAGNVCTGEDSGVAPAVDSGTAADSSPAIDGALSTADAGDGDPTPDSGSDPAPDAGSSFGVQDAGCGCRAGGRPSGAPTEMMLVLLVACTAWVLRRRRTLPGMRTPRQPIVRSCRSSGGGEFS